MRYINNGNAQFLLNRRNFKAHAFTQLGVKVRQRFVQKQKAGAHYQRTRQCNTLLLAAGKLMRITAAVLVKMHEFKHFRNSCSAFFFGNFLNFKRICNVFGNSHVRPYGIRLENHADIAFFGRHESIFYMRAYAVVADINFTFCRSFKAGNHTQRSCFAAAGRAEERNKFAVLYGKVKIAYGRNITKPFKNMLYTYF